MGRLERSCHCPQRIAVRSPQLTANKSQILAQSDRSGFKEQKTRPEINPTWFVFSLFEKQLLSAFFSFGG
jgi:hypothetical protein